MKATKILLLITGLIFSPFVAQAADLSSLTSFGSDSGSGSGPVNVKTQFLAKSGKSHLLYVKINPRGGNAKTIFLQHNEFPKTVSFSGSRDKVTVVIKILSTGGIVHTSKTYIIRKRSSGNWRVTNTWGNLSTGGVTYKLERSLGKKNWNLVIK